jgi:hypothetical protein
VDLPLRVRLPAPNRNAQAASGFATGESVALSAPRQTFDPRPAGVRYGDEFGPGEPSHWYGNRLRYRVHDDRGRPGGGVRDAGRPVGPRRHRRHRLGAPVPGRRSHHRRRPGVPDGDVPRGPPGQGLQDRQPGRGVRRTAGHRVAARAGVARNRGAQLRRLDLALRPRGDRPVANEGDADLRLVSGPAPGARIPPVPASQSARWPTRRTLR